MFPMRPDNGSRSDKRGDNNGKISLVDENNTGKNDDRNIMQKVKGLDFAQLIIVKSAIENKVGYNCHSDRNQKKPFEIAREKFQ